MSYMEKSGISSDRELKKFEDTVNALSYIHYQFYPEDRITTVFIEDHLPCPKKSKKCSIYKKKSAIKKRIMLRIERTNLRKEWRKCQMQIKKGEKNLPSQQQKQSNLKVSHLPKVCSVLANPQSKNVSIHTSFPNLLLPINHMSFQELLQYKEHLNYCLMPVCNRNSTSNRIIRCSMNDVSVKSYEKCYKVRKAISFDRTKIINKQIKSEFSYSSNSIEKNELTIKSSATIVDIQRYVSLIANDKPSGQFLLASMLLKKGVEIIKRNNSKEYGSMVSDGKDLIELISKLKNCQRSFNRYALNFKLSTPKYLQKLVLEHMAQTNPRYSSKKLESQLHHCNFSYDKDLGYYTEISSEEMPSGSESIKMNRELLRKYNEQNRINKAENISKNLKGPNKMWLKIEKLIGNKSYGEEDLFVNVVKKKLRKKN